MAAAAFVPLATTLLPVVLPEIEKFIQLVEGAFQKKAAPPAGTPATPQGPQKLATVAEMTRILLNSLTTSGFPQPDEQGLLGFIEATFQNMKAAGVVSAPPTPAPQPAPQPSAGVVQLGSRALVIVP